MQRAVFNEVVSRLEEASNGFPKVFLKKWCAERDFPFEMLIMQCRKKPVVELRKQALMAFRERYPKMSYPAMGRIFKRDHTTIMSALGVLSRNSRKAR